MTSLKIGFMIMKVLDLKLDNWIVLLEMQTWFLNEIELEWKKKCENNSFKPLTCNPWRVNMQPEPEKGKDEQMEKWTRVANLLS